MLALGGSSDGDSFPCYVFIKVPEQVFTSLPIDHFLAPILGESNFLAVWIRTPCQDFEDQIVGYISIQSLGLNNVQEWLKTFIEWNDSVMDRYINLPNPH